MRSLKKRLDRLESVLWDQSQSKRYSEEWLGYWGLQVERVLNGDRSAPRIPIEFFDAIAEADPEDGLAECKSSPKEIGMKMR